MIEKYFKAKIFEFILLYIIIFLAMSMYFNYRIGNFQDIATNADEYTTYALGLFLFYIYLCIINRKTILQYQKVTGKIMYNELKIGNKIQKSIHRYLAIFLFIVMTMVEINFKGLSYIIWFYMLLIIQTILLLIAIRYSMKVSRNIV
jgi:hypothetical protein